MKKTILLFVLLGTVFFSYAQQGDFCDAVNTIMRDGPNKFRNIRGQVLNASANATIWDCGVKVPGTINSRFVASMGLFYEGAFLQTRDKGALKAVYDSCALLLDSCLLSHGYTLSKNDNFYPGLGDYKKLVYINDVADDSFAVNAPPHVTLEAAYNKDAGTYTIVMYIFEH